MTHDAQPTSPEAAIDSGEGREWAPSRAPEHRLSSGEIESQGRIVEASARKGWLRGYLARPFVRLVIGLGIFIFGAIVYDTTVNYGSWTMKSGGPKGNPHRGAAPVPKGAAPVPRMPEESGPQ